MVCKNLKELEQQITSRIQKSLKKDVAPVIKTKMVEAVQDTVYDSYKPSMYERRQENGGLSDTDNMKDTCEGLSLSVKNETPYNEDYGGLTGVKSNGGENGLDALIAMGDGYNDLHYDYTKTHGRSSYKDPRDFYERTKEILEEDKAHVTALKNGLKEQGLEVE